MMIALVGLNANAAIYLVGNEPLGQGWDPSKGIEMTDNGDGTYTYDVVINGDVWFCFADGLDASWDTFNGTHRYGPKKNGADEVITAGQWTTTQLQGNGNGSYQFHGSGDKYTVTFDLTNLKFKIDGYVEPVVYESFTVAGNNADIFGAEWNVTLTENDMTLDETDGLYKLVKENVEITNAPYTLYYKVAANHAWGESWGNPEGPSGNQDYVFNENGTYDLTFKFNFDTKEVTLEAVQTQVGPEVDDFYTVAGSENLFGSYWNATDTLNMMTEGENGMFTWTKVGFEATAGTEVEFKVVANGNWNTCWPASDEEGDHNWYYKFEEDGVYTVAITFNEDTKEINLTATRTGDLPEPPQPEVDDVYIIGDVNEIGWSATQGVKMTYNEGIYTAEITTQKQGDLELGYFGFTKKLADPESETAWDDIAAFRFGPVSDDAFVMTEELLNVNCDLATDGSYNSIAIPAGTWTVTVDLVNNKFAINGEWPSVEPEHYDGDVYIMGEVNDNGGWFTNKGVKMTRDAENNVYTATITTAGENIPEGEEVGYSYFSFTKQLAETEADWDAIAPYRFGAVSEGDFLVTEELLGETLALENGGDAYKIPAGEWNLTLSVDNMTLVIEKAASVIRGDVNKDGVVNISDVTSLIDLLLSGGEMIPEGDCNQDGAMNITDVTVLIDYLLGGNNW